jgi:hypothetical protein
VTLGEADEDDLRAIHATYRRKCGRHASIVDQIDEPRP